MSIRATGITKKFGRYTALDNVDFHAPSGKLVALLGPSGSGKTTLLRILAGLEFADEGSGRIEFHGEDVTATPAGKRGVGFVFQHYALFRHMTVFENIAFGLRVKGRGARPSDDKISDRVHELLKLVQLDGLDRRFPSQLSGGQRQRVALARALAVEPKVLLLDEPFGALDAKVRKELRRWLRQFHDEIHLTTVFVTHDQEEALEIADEVVVMNNARVEQVGAPQEVYDRPASPFVHRFLGQVNVLRDASAWARTGPVHDNGRLASDGLVYVRPHDIEVHLHHSDDLGVPAVLRYVHTAGPRALLTFEVVATGEIIDADLSRSEFISLGLKPADLARLRLRPTQTFHDYAI
ncbi:MAG: sulfate ABC transporter ATP-binding protein [Opitutaceae bacterium]|nr:sulfate ABC transporter ATP-binding protein [Opitutaceae bacterium]